MTDAATVARIANALKAAAADYPEFKQTISELRTIHGQQAVTAALQRLNATTTVPDHWT